MIVVDKPRLKFLLAGRTITVTTAHEHHKRGRTYAVGVAHNRPATCTATITAIRVTDSGRELDIVQNRDPGDLYMARYSPKGYTTRLSEALGREDAPVLEANVQAKYSKEANERDQKRRRDERAQTPLGKQIDDLQARADKGDQQAKRHLFMIQKHLDEDAKRKARDAA